MHRSNLLLQSARQLRSRSTRLHSSSTSSNLTASSQRDRRYTSMASSTAPSWSEWRLDPPCAIPSDSVTLAHHASLPKLPVPELKSTAEKVLRSAKALAKDDSEYKALESKLDAFLKPDGPGQRLQSKLQARAKDECVVWSVVEPGEPCLNPLLHLQESTELPCRVVGHSRICA